MDIADQFKEMAVFIADDGFITVLKQVARPLMPQVKGYGIAG